MNYNKINQYAPPSPKWVMSREMKVEDVDIWEILVEIGGPVGVYAAWCPYGEMYMVVDRGTIKETFSGWNANKRLENYLIQQRIPYPKV